MQPTYKPDRVTLERVEALLREELMILGIDIATLAPHDIARYMRCGVHANGCLTYAWKGMPLLDIVPNVEKDGTVSWRFYTHDETVQ